MSDVTTMPLGYLAAAAAKALLYYDFFYKEAEAETRANGFLATVGAFITIFPFYFSYYFVYFMNF